MVTEQIYRVGIYLRLSREDEKLGESESISTQRDLLKNYIKENNLVFISEYIDDGISGTTFNRSGFNQMIKDCESKKINMIITKDTSRLGRDHIEFGYYVERYFPEHNIRYVAVNDGIDTFSNNSANDMLVFKSAFNDMYVKDISNKLRSSLYTKKRKGLFIGTYAPYGYKKSLNDKHKLEIDNHTAPIVKRIFNMFINGNSVTKICSILTQENIKTPSMEKNMKVGESIHYGVWSTRTVSDILKNQTYIGNLTQCRQRKINYKSKKRIHTKESDWIIVEGVVPKIIENKVFFIAQNMLKMNKNHTVKDGITNKLLLRGLIYCKECHHTIGFRAIKTNTIKRGLVTRIYGNCNYWSKRKKEHVCTPHSVKYEEIEKLVLKDLRSKIKHTLTKDSLINVIEQNKIMKKENIMKKIKQSEQDIKNNNKKIEICYKDKLEGNITLDIYKRIYNSLVLEIKELQREKKYQEELYREDNTSSLDNINQFLELKNPTKSLISHLIDRIEIDEDNNIDIYYKFRLV